MAKKIFTTESTRPLIIAGPCMAESFELLCAVIEPIYKLSKKLEFDFLFKASFDKANRTSADSYRGPGLETTLKWFSELKSKYNEIPLVTDVHETNQVSRVAEVCDVLQIPAFLCRQTDLVVESVKTQRAVNIKKGQFLAPQAMLQIVEKAKSAAQSENCASDVAITERGASFGYGDLIVDMRGFKTMSGSGVPVLFDITHSTQEPPTSGKTSGGSRQYAPLLMRSALATGYVNGFFLEVHTDPKKAKSDSAIQLTIEQAGKLITQAVEMWKLQPHRLKEIDSLFV